jgi:outer membrane receptor protein involved in Fe transport
MLRAAVEVFPFLVTSRKDDGSFSMSPRLRHRSLYARAFPKGRVMNRPSELHDDCNITRTLLLRSLIALFAAHAAPLALAQNRDAASESTASPQVPVATRLATVLVEGLGRRSSPDALDAGTVGGLGLRKVGEAADLSAASVRRIEDWIEQEGLATVGAGGQLGLASNFASRGFSANSQSTSGLGSSRLFANGHPDIARRFTRDLSSVERVEFVLAQDSTLFGAASPGSALNYVLKQPSGRDVSAWSGSLGTTGLLQSVIDLDRPLTSTTAVRVVASGLVGDVGVERIEARRGNLLLSLKTQVASTTLRLEAETQHNASPFVFGTVYTGGKFWYDTPLVSPLSAAARTYTRYGAYARTPFAVGNQVFDLSVHAQSAETKRDETLLGFWTVTGSAEVSGYYRELKEAHRQTDLGVQLGSSWQLANTQHRTQVVIQRNTQSLVFDGPQRIAGFNINLNAPDINVDISKLTLAPRTLVENRTECSSVKPSRFTWGFDALTSASTAQPPPARSSLSRVRRPTPHHLAARGRPAPSYVFSCWAAGRSSPHAVNAVTAATWNRYLATKPARV